MYGQISVYFPEGVIGLITRSTGDRNFQILEVVRNLGITAGQFIIEADGKFRPSSSMRVFFHSISYPDFGKIQGNRRDSSLLFPSSIPFVQ